MSVTRPRNDLAERKRLLVLEADLHRALLCAECAQARARWGWLDEACGKARSAGLWLAVGGAALGLFSAWRGRKLLGWIPTAFSAWRAIQKIRAR